MVNLIIDQWNHGYKIIIWKCLQYITKENLLSLKDLLEPWKMKFISRWLQYQKNVYIAKLDLQGEEIFGMFYKKELQNAKQK